MKVYLVLYNNLWCGVFSTKEKAQLFKETDTILKDYTTIIVETYLDNPYGLKINET